VPPGVSDSLLRRTLWTLYAVGQVPLQRRAPFRSPAALRRLQDRRVRAAVAFAYAHVPHYREALDRLGLPAAAFRTAADLARLPLLERDELQRDPERFVARALPRDRLELLATDGSTGAPVLVCHDPFALFQGAAHYQRSEAVVLRLARRRLILRRVLIGSPDGTVLRTSHAVRRRSTIPPGLRYRDLHLSIADPPAANAERMLAFAADEVRGYGSYLEEVFRHVSRIGASTGLPRVVVFGEDAISDPARRMISDELGIPVLSEYSAGEAHHIGFECEAHTGLHLNEDFCPVRLVDADGAEVPAGLPGEVVISNLVNRGTVLLNYRLGDVAARRLEPCPCGRSLPLMSFPTGRTDEWVLSSSGELVYGQVVRGLLLADDADLLGFQVVQRTPAEFSVAAVVRDGCDRAAFAAGVERRFAERFGAGTRTELSFVDSLPRTAGGKVRTIIGCAGARVPPPGSV
jgi:phenylacetate-CoA ligase